MQHWIDKRALVSVQSIFSSELFEFRAVDMQHLYDHGVEIRQHMCFEKVSDVESARCSTLLLVRVHVCVQGLDFESLLL